MSKSPTKTASTNRPYSTAHKTLRTIIALVVIVSLTGCRSWQAFTKLTQQGDQATLAEQRQRQPESPKGSLADSGISDELADSGAVMQASYHELPTPGPVAVEAVPPTPVVEGSSNYAYQQPAQPTYGPTPYQDRRFQPRSTYGVGRYPSRFDEPLQGARTGSFSQNGNVLRNDGPVYEGTELNRPRQKPVTEIALERQARKQLLSNQNKLLSSEKKSLERQLNSRETQMKKLQSDLSYFQNRSDQLNGENADLKAQVSQLGDQLVQSNSRHQRDIEELTRTISAFERLWDSAEASEAPTTNNGGPADNQQTEPRKQTAPDNNSTAAARFLAPPQTYSVIDQAIEPALNSQQLLDSSNPIRYKQ